MYLLSGRPIRKGSARQIAHGSKNDPMTRRGFGWRERPKFSYCPEKFDQKLALLAATFQLMKWPLQEAVKDE